MGHKQFAVNHSYLEKAAAVVSGHPNIVWVLGGSCSGKSRVCSYAETTLAVSVYDMDKYIFGEYFERYDANRHPATTEWFYQENGLDWVLSLSWEEFDSLNAAVAAEYLDLFADDVDLLPKAQGLLVDGGLARPYVLRTVLDPGSIVCLKRDEEKRSAEWETNPSRIEMKKMILELENGKSKWEKFLDFDSRMTSGMLKESADNKMVILDVEEDTPAAHLASMIIPESWL